MTLRQLWISLPVTGCVLLSGCKPKDSEVRRYLRDDLRPYLDSVAYQLCQIKSRAAPDVPGRTVCTGPPEGYKKPPPDGDP
jgi:hypothetical protein